MQHEGEEDQKVQHCQQMGQALTVAREPPKARESAKAALQHPAPGQQHKVLYSVGKLDYPQFNTYCLRSVLGAVAGAALVGPGHFHRLASGFPAPLRMPF